MGVKDDRAVPGPAVAAYLLTVLVELFLGVGNQDKAVLAASPWQDDPFHTWVSLAVFALPALLAVTALRAVGGWLPWGRSSSVARQRDLVRAGLVMTSFDAVTVAVCWLAVALRWDRQLWDSTTPWLVAVVGALTVPVPVVVWLGMRWLRSRNAVAAPDDVPADWVADVLPAPLAAWVRRHDRLVFLTASVVAACGIVGGLALGEGWTNLLLIGWAVALEITCYYAFCVLTNAVLGFIARPPRDRRTERAVVVGSLAFQLAVAMHNQLAPLIGFGAPGGVGRLVQVTVVPALAAFAVALVLLRLGLRPGSRARPAR